MARIIIAWNSINETVTRIIIAWNQINQSVERIIIVGNFQKRNRRESVEIFFLEEQICLYLDNGFHMVSKMYSNLF